MSHLNVRAKETKSFELFSHKTIIHIHRSERIKAPYTVSKKERKSNTIMFSVGTMTTLLTMLAIIVGHVAAVGMGNQRTCRDQRFRCPLPRNMNPAKAHTFEDFVAIANRSGGTVSLVDPDTLETMIEFELPNGGEPMYVIFGNF